MPLYNCIMTSLSLYFLRRIPCVQTVLGFNPKTGLGLLEQMRE